MRLSGSSVRLFAAVRFDPACCVRLVGRLVTSLCVAARQLCAPVRQLCAPVRRCAVRSGLLCAAGWPTCHVTLCGGQAALCACQAALCACSPLCGSIPACCVRLVGRLVTLLCVAARQLCAPVRQLCAPVRRCAVQSRPDVCGWLADLSRHSVWRPGGSVRLSGSSVRLFAAVRLNLGLLCAAGWPTCHVTLCGGQAALCACQAALCACSPLCGSIPACCVRLIGRLVTSLCVAARQLCAPVRRCAFQSRPAVCGWLADLSRHSVWRPGSSVRLSGSSVRLFAAVRFNPGLLCAAGWPTCHVTLCDGQAAMCACYAVLVLALLCAAGGTTCHVC